jgi:hypothetical protein
MRMLRTALAASAFLLATPAFPATIIAGQAVTPNGPSVGSRAGTGSTTEAIIADFAMLAGGSLAGLVLAGTLFRRRRPRSVIA